jgi:hypothetical protein
VTSKTLRHLTEESQVLYLGSPGDVHFHAKLFSAFAITEYVHRSGSFFDTCNHQSERRGALVAMAIALDGQNVTSTVTLQDIVFSCEICHATIPEIYASPESNRGIHGGSREEQGIVTKLWITDCAHVTCTKHLNGGGRFDFCKDTINYRQSL